MEKIRSS